MFSGYVPNNLTIFQKLEANEPSQFCGKVIEYLQYKPFRNKKSYVKSYTAQTTL